MDSNVTDLGTKVLFLLIPGIIGFNVVAAYGPKRSRSDLEIGLQIFVYGVVAYVVAGLIVSTGTILEGFPWRQPLKGILLIPEIFKLTAQNSLVLATADASTDLSKVHVLLATISSVIVGIVVSVFQTHSLSHQVLQFFHLTKRTSETDMWNFTLNSPDIDSWVTVRHHENGKVYQGWIRGYSDGESDRELLLADVKVFASPPERPGELEEVDQIPVLYLGLDRQNLTLELNVKPK